MDDEKIFKVDFNKEVIIRIFEDTIISIVLIFFFVLFLLKFLFYEDDTIVVNMLSLVGNALLVVLHGKLRVIPLIRYLRDGYLSINEKTGVITIVNHLEHIVNGKVMWRERIIPLLRMSILDIQERISSNDTSTYFVLTDNGEVRIDSEPFLYEVFEYCSCTRKVNIRRNMFDRIRRHAVAISLAILAMCVLIGSICLIDISEELVNIGVIILGIVAFIVVVLKQRKGKR